MDVCSKRNTARLRCACHGNAVAVRRYPLCHDMVMRSFFSDIVGYTSMSSQLEPRIVLRMLHRYFSRLDSMLERISGFKYQTVSSSCVPSPYRMLRAD